MPRLLNHITTKQGAIIALLTMGIGTLIGIIQTSQILFWIGLVLNSSAAALAFSFIITLFSRLADKGRQGWIMGITGAIIAIAWAITALLTGLLIIYSTVLAGYLAVLFSFIGALFVMTNNVNASW